MDKPCEVIFSPDKSNILYTIYELKGSLLSNAIFHHILNELRVKRTSLNRILIYCKCKTNCAELYRFFSLNLGDEFTEPPGASTRIPECLLVDMFFKGTEEVKDSIITNFTKPSPLQIVIATVALGMGVNCPDVNLIIHVGPPHDIENYVQEVGRGGRDGAQAFAILHNKKLLKKISEYMTRYVNNMKECRRDSLYNFFINIPIHKKIMDATTVTFAISYVHVDNAERHYPIHTIHLFHYFINNIYSLFIVFHCLLFLLLFIVYCVNE